MSRTRAAFHQLPLAVVKGDTPAAAGAQPSDAVPTFATLCAGVKTLHFATAFAFLRGDSWHESPKNVVNINPPF